jgi:hypothetical protein
MKEELFFHIIEQIPQITDYPIRLHIDGEPMLHPQFFSFAKLLNRKNIKFNLASNGSKCEERFLELEINILRITFSTNAQEFSTRCDNITYDIYYETILNYIKLWLKSESKQNIILQILYYKSNDVNYNNEKTDFIKRLTYALSYDQNILFHYAREGMNDVYSYTKQNGYSITIFPWYVYYNQIFFGESFSNNKVEIGFCSSPWEIIAIMFDGRVSFCCNDLSGKTAFTSPDEIWNRKLIDIWQDQKICEIRKRFVEKKIPLEICKKCLFDHDSNIFLTNFHPINIIPNEKFNELKDKDSLGNII